MVSHYSTLKIFFFSPVTPTSIKKCRLFDSTLSTVLKAIRLLQQTKLCRLSNNHNKGKKRKIHIPGNILF